ncbi:MAG: trypsin-like peptidase domain-containing protein [Elusimicrobia bacterium]|nr:trypsin-like peptidase domain-containing protein [Elusimicrobiota bacterium]
MLHTLILFSVSLAMADGFDGRTYKAVWDAVSPGLSVLPAAHGPRQTPIETAAMRNRKRVIKQAQPAVVLIRVGQERAPVEDGMGKKNPKKRGGLGSGVILDSYSGLVVTNAHVVENAGKGGGVDVVLLDGRKIKGTVIDLEPKEDIALLRIQAGGLASLPLGDSDLVEDGDDVIAIGHPFGLRNTKTAGIISNAKQTLNQPGLNLSTLIQTDTPINPGNSGGPLIDMEGHMIGINTAVAATADGVGFAIPSNNVKKALGRYAKSGALARAQIGIKIDLPGPNEAPGVKVMTGSEGAGGLMTGDIIIQADEVDLSQSPDPILKLYEALSSKVPGERIRLRIRRGESTLLVEAPLH